MTKTRFTPWVVLACIGALAGCTSGEGGTAGNTELNVVIPNNGGQSPAPDGTPQPAAFDIQVVEYTIACNDGADNGPFLDNNASFNDDVTINGVLEVLDVASPGVSDQDFGPNLDDVYVWQGFMDLPPTAGCTVQLRARDGDGEVICTSTETFDIAADSLTKVNVLMYCGISFQAPVGMLDLDADFSFNVANFCPDLFVLNCIDSELDVRTIPGVGEVLATACQVRFRDGDSQCGDSCDPQTCTPTPTGLDCVPGPDPGVSTTITCASTLGACAISCDGLNPAASCSFSGDTLGAIGDPPPGPLAPGTGGFFVSCATIDDDGDPLTPEVPLTPGDDIVCTAVTTDGDVDCDKTKEVDLTITGLSPCQDFAAGGGSCDDGNSCTDDVCTDATCDGTQANCCTNPNSPAGQTCTDGGGFPGTCDGAGACVSTNCNAQPDPAGFCDDGNVCTANACEADGSCSTTATNNGGACASGVGSGIGTCSAGACVSSDACQVDADCTDPGTATDCQVALCDTSVTPYVCGGQDAPNGTSCSPPAGGTCDAGVCSTPPVIDAGGGTTSWVAESLPIGSNGGPTATSGGCAVFVTALNTTIYIQVTLTLDVTSDGANNIGTAWTVDAQHFLLPTLGAAAELGGFDINAEATNTVGGPINSGLTAAATGQLIGAYIVGDTLTISTPGEITAGAAALTPTGGAGSTVNVNWNGQFSLDLTLGGNPLVVVDESVCAFTIIGGGVNLGVN